MRHAAAGLAAVLSLTVLALLAGIGWSLYRDRPPAVKSVNVVGSKHHIGDAVPVDIVAECPWYRLPALPLEISPPQGAQVLSDGERHLVGLDWGIWRWRCRIMLQPLTLGASAGGEARVSWTPGRRVSENTMSVELPSLQVKSSVAADEEEPVVASPFERHAFGGVWGMWTWAVPLALLILGVAVAWYWWRFPRNSGTVREIPPWESAREELQTLEHQLPLPAEAFFTRLTDIVRTYLERRFEVPAGEQTTPEFLHSLQHSSILDEEETRRLGAFLQAADMVKFARADSTQEQLQASLGQARRLIALTEPQAVEKNPAAREMKPDSAAGKEATRHAPTGGQET